MFWLQTIFKGIALPMISDLDSMAPFFFLGLGQSSDFRHGKTAVWRDRFPSKSNMFSGQAVKIKSTLDASNPSMVGKFTWLPVRMFSPHRMECCTIQTDKSCGFQSCQVLSQGTIMKIMTNLVGPSKHALY